MRPFTFACLGLLLLPLTARCQNGTGIYMEPGLVLRAAPPRQLTLNANVPQFLYQPGGDSLAYVSVHDDNAARTVNVKFVGAHQKDPDTRTLYTVTGDAPDAQTSTPSLPIVDLQGWSGDGRYLIFAQEDATGLQSQMFCGDIGTESFHARPIPMPAGAAPGFQSLTQGVWSPAHDRFLILQSAVGPSQTRLAEVYVPAQDKVQPLTVPDGLFAWGWLNEGHLLFKRSAEVKGGQPVYLSHDVATSVETEITRPSPWPPARGNLFFQALPSPTAPKLPGLTLETLPHTLKDAQGVAETKAQTVWIRRAKAPKALSALSVGVTPGADDPQAQWSPEGDGVSFIAHGDLFVAALTKQEATAREKVAAGEKLGCDEEKQIIMANLKQLGLGILQYTQDNDEKFPAGEGFHDAVFPYIKDESVFNFAGVRPAYHAPTNPSLAAMDAPADTVLATADTPCAHIVLYADGHVKAFDKAGATGP